MGGQCKITAVDVVSVDIAEQGAVESDIKGVVAAGGDDRVVRLYDLVSGITLATFEGHEDGISSLGLFVGLVDPRDPRHHKKNVRVPINLYTCSGSDDGMTSESQSSYLTP